MKNLLYIPIALIITMISIGTNLQAQQLQNSASGICRARVIAKIITVVSESRDSIVSRDGGRTWLPTPSAAPASLQESIQFSDRQKSDTMVKSDWSKVSVYGHSYRLATEMRTIAADGHPFEMAFLSRGSVD